MNSPAPGENDPYHKWGGAFFHGIHSMFINPVVTILTIAAFFVQVREISTTHSPWPLSSSLSVLGLVVQAVVFAVVALAWPWRLVFPWDKVGEGIPWAPSFWLSWYQLIGWVVDDNAFFAIVQAVLFWVAWRRGQRGDSDIGNGESDSLLRG